MQYKSILDIEHLDDWLALNLPFEYNDFMNPFLLEDHTEIKRRINRYNAVKRDRSNDTLHGPFYDIAVHSVDPQIRTLSDRRIRQACNIALELKAKAVVLHTNLIGNFYNAAYRRHWVDANEQYFQTLLKDYKALNIYMENMFDEEPDCLCLLAERMHNERFGICLDIGHCNISKTDIPTWIDRCNPYVKQYHINDNDGKTDGHLAVGDGTIDWQSILPRLKAEMPVLIEVKEREAFLKSREFLFSKGVKTTAEI